MSVQKVLVLIERGWGVAWSHGEATVLGPGGELRAPRCSLGEDSAVRLLDGTDTMHRAPSCFSIWDWEPLTPCRHPPPTHTPQGTPASQALRNPTSSPPFCKRGSCSAPRELRVEVNHTLLGHTGGNSE